MKEMKEMKSIKVVIFFIFATAISASAGLYVDFIDGNQSLCPVQDGYEGFLGNNDTVVTTNYVNDMYGGNISVTVSNATHSRYYDRVVPPAPLTNLLSTCVLSDVTNSPMVMTLSGLEPGDYTLKTFHYNSGSSTFNSVYSMSCLAPQSYSVSYTGLTQDRIHVETNEFSFTTTSTDKDVTIEMAKTSAAGQAKINGFDLIPEPSAISLMGVAGVGLLVARRRYLRRV